VKVDRHFCIAFTAPVVDDDALAAVKSAYNAVAQGFQTAGRQPALVEVRVYAKPEVPA